MWTDTRATPGRAVQWATVAAVVFVAAASVFVVPFFGWPTLANSDGALALASLLAAGIVGWVGWLLVEGLAPDHPILGGVGAGLFTGVFAHPVAWFLWPLLPLNEQSWSAVLMPFMSVWSLLFFVWITVPLAVVAGVATGGIRVAVRRLR